MEPIESRSGFRCQLPESRQREQEQVIGTPKNRLRFRSPSANSVFRVISVSSCQFRAFQNRKQLEPEQTEMEKDQSVMLPAPAVPKAAATEQ